MTTLSTEKPPVTSSHKADPSSDVYRSETHPLDSLFLAQERCRDWRLRARRQRRPLRAVEPAEQSVRRDGVSGQLQAPQRAGYQGLSQRYENCPKRSIWWSSPLPPTRCPIWSRNRWRVGIPAGIVISAGFKEAGEHGKELERQISQIIRGKMRLIGPNCLGVMNPIRGLNATFAHTVARSRQRRLHQPERRTVHRGTRLELARECRLQRLRLHRLHARRELGRPDRLLRQ